MSLCLTVRWLCFLKCSFINPSTTQGAPEHGVMGSIELLKSVYPSILGQHTKPHTAPDAEFLCEWTLKYRYFLFRCFLLVWF